MIVEKAYRAKRNIINTYKSDAALRHHRNRHRRLDALDHRGVAHARNASRRAYVGRDALERHHGARARLLGDLRLLWRSHVHYHAALEHLREVAVQFLPVCHFESPSRCLFSNYIESEGLIN